MSMFDLSPLTESEECVKQKIFCSEHARRAVCRSSGQVTVANRGSRVCLIISVLSKTISRKEELHFAGGCRHRRETENDVWAGRFPQLSRDKSVSFTKGDSSERAPLQCGPLPEHAGGRERISLHV